MSTVEIKTIRELNYGVCEHILRNRLQNVFVWSDSSKIIDSLVIYMTEVGIPWEFDSSMHGICVKGNIVKDLVNVYIHSSMPFEQFSSPDSADVDFLLRDNEKGRINALVKDPETFDLNSVPPHLQNEEIRKMFIKSFMIAESEIDIISPWMNFSVVNDALINLMKQSLRRGVRIRIIYGILTGADEYDQARSERSDQVAMRLKREFSEFGDLFKISRDNTHYKLVLCDEKFKLEGGYNYLSFTGDYSDPSTRREGSPFGRDAEEIRYLRKEYFRDDQMER